jgi:RNA polymerase sigma factor (sigma-70 family)
MNQTQEIKSLTQQEWNEWYNKVYGYFFRRVDSRSDVEDLTAITLNDFFLKTDVKNPQGLIWVIARNKLTDFIRSKPKNHTISLDNLPENLIAQSDVYSDRYQNRIEHLKECVKKNLKEQDYSIVELCTISDFSSEVVAAQLNLSPANVRQKLSRSLKKVREICRRIWQE